MTVSPKKKTGLITVTGILLLIAFALGFTVHPAVWDTRNVILTGLPYFIGCGAAAILQRPGSDRTRHLRTDRPALPQLRRHDGALRQ